MSLHPTEAEIRRYREKSLDVKALLAISDHLSICPECRSRVAPGGTANFSVRTVRAEFQPPHLSFEQLKSFADGQLKDPAAKEHLEACYSCREEAYDLRSFASETRLPQSWSWTGNKRIWAWGFGVATVAVAAALFAVLPSRHAEPLPSAITAVQKPEYADLIASVAAAGKIDIPPQVAQLAGRKHQLLGGGDTIHFRILSPAGTATSSDQPEFRWESLAKARSYRVSVYDKDYNPVLVSPVLKQTSWQPTAKLPRGRVYSWQVTAVVPGEEISAPQPPEPEARFTPLAEAEALRLAHIRAKNPEAHLALGILYGQAGAVEESAAELRRAIALGDHADEAERLLRTLQRPGS